MKLDSFSPTSILVPLDDRLGAAPSLRLVERLAAAARARVTLLHVVGVVHPAAAHDSTSLNLAATQARAELHDAGALASHGRGGLSRAVLGSVAIDIVSRAAIPTVVVPPLARVPAWRRAPAECQERNAHGG